MNVNMEKAAEMLVDAGQALQKVASERDSLAQQLAVEREKNATMEKRMEAEKVAAEMHDKGIHVDTPLDKLASALESEPDERLEVIKQALQMRPGDVMRGTSLSDAPSRSDGSDFENFILGTVG
jgi:hypothetical protein